jgi:hypothetical protein
MGDIHQHLFGDQSFFVFKYQNKRYAKYKVEHCFCKNKKVQIVKNKTNIKQINI